MNSLYFAVFCRSLNTDRPFYQNIWCTEPSYMVFGLPEIVNWARGLDNPVMYIDGTHGVSFGEHTLLQFIIEDYYAGELTCKTTKRY